MPAEDRVMYPYSGQGALRRSGHVPDIQEFALRRSGHRDVLLKTSYRTRFLRPEDIPCTTFRQKLQWLDHAYTTLGWSCAAGPARNELARQKLLMAATCTHNTTVCVCLQSLQRESW